MAKKTLDALARSYLQLLAEEGYRPEYERLGDTYGAVSFKSEGERFALLADENDEHFFHLSVAYTLDGIDLGAAVDRANELNETLKAVKVSASGRGAEAGVRFSIEAYLDVPANIDHVEGALRLLRNAAGAFFQASRPAEALDA